MPVTVGESKLFADDDTAFLGFVMHYDPFVFGTPRDLVGFDSRKIAARAFTTF